LHLGKGGVREGVVLRHNGLTDVGSDVIAKGGRFKRPVSGKILPESEFTIRIYLRDGEFGEAGVISGAGIYSAC